MSDYQQLLASFFQLMNMNGASHVYREACRAGILAAVDSGKQSVEEIAEHCHTAAGPTELMLEVLEVLGLVARGRRGYGLTALAYGLLSGTYHQLGDEYWAHLPSFLRSGKSLGRMTDIVQIEKHYQAQAAALAWMLAPAAEEAASLLSVRDSHEMLDILDVGAGAAMWSLSIAVQTPGARVTAVDFPTVLEVARETARSLEVEARLTCLAGDFHQLELPTGRFDLAIIANVTHLESSEGNLALFTKLHRSLRIHGKIAIIDVFPGQREGDLNRTVYALGLSLRNENGRVHQPEELSDLLARSGFGATQLTPLRLPPYIMGVLTATVMEGS